MIDPFHASPLMARTRTRSRACGVGVCAPGHSGLFGVLSGPQQREQKVPDISSHAAPSPPSESPEAKPRVRTIISRTEREAQPTRPPVHNYPWRNSEGGGRAAAQHHAVPLGEGEMPLEKRAGVNGIAAGSADRSESI